MSAELILGMKAVNFSPNEMAELVYKAKTPTFLPNPEKYWGPKPKPQSKAIIDKSIT